MKSLLTIALVGLVAQAGARQGFDFVARGAARPIAVPHGAALSTELAAKELAEFAGRVTGVRPQVIVGAPPDGAVVIGTVDTLPDAPMSVLAALSGEKSHEASVTAAVGGRYWIVGKTEVAELFGTYRVLQEEVGVRWFKAWEPDDPGWYVPSADAIRLDGALRVRKPSFGHRKLCQTGSDDSVIPTNGLAWAARNCYQLQLQGAVGIRAVERFCGGVPDGSASRYQRDRYLTFRPRAQVEAQIIGGGHMMIADPIPVEKYFDAHPEYFALKDGRRRREPYYCHSNPEVRRLVQEDVIRRLKITGGRGNYTFGLMDNTSSKGVCECDACRALDSAEERALPLNANVSTRFHGMVADLCQDIYAACPGASGLLDWAYSNYKEPPAAGVRLDPRLAIQLCPKACFGHALDDPSCGHNVGVLDYLARWRRHSPQCRFVMVSFANCAGNHYTPYERVFARDLAVLVKFGIDGWEEEMTYADGRTYRDTKDPAVHRRYSERSLSNCQWFYAMGQLLWNKDQSVDELLADAESKYYGAAYPAMRDYHALRRRLWENAGECIGHPFGDGRTPLALNESDAKERLLKLLDDAEALLRDSGNDGPYRMRVGRDRRWLQEFWIAPNEKLRARQGKMMRVPFVRTSVSVDGVGSAPAWSGAAWTGDFRTDDGKETPPPSELATRAGILADAENLYFLFRCREPALGKMRVRDDPRKVWDDDGVEIFLYSPSEGNATYHIGVNAGGTVALAQHQPDAPLELDGLEVKTSRQDDGYAIELRVPVRRIWPLRDGEFWKILLVRNRTVSDLHARAASWSLDGASVFARSEYRSVQIGVPCLLNGSFEDLDEKGRTKAWSCVQGASIVPVGSQKAAHLSGWGCVLQCPCTALPRAKAPRTVSFRLKARGKGRVAVRFYREGAAKNLPTETAATFELTDQDRLCEGTYVIRPDELITFGIAGCGEGCDAIVDDVSLCSQ